MARAGYDREVDLTPRGSRPPFPVDDPDVTWGDALQRIADTIPDRIAVDDGKSRTTYSELVRRANQSAHALLDADADADDDADRPVAVVARQGLGAVVAILAPLHAQRISSPLDAAAAVRSALA